MRRCAVCPVHCPRKVHGPPNHMVPTFPDAASSVQVVQITTRLVGDWVCHTRRSCRRQEPMELIQEPGSTCHRLVLHGAGLA